jgi:asparagine synthase (glutamine-hydrolysing)
VSGFVGLWQRDGRPVDPAQLAALTEALRFRGPDGTHAVRRGAVGLGHARCTTHARRDGAPQPLGLDERAWITGDIRLDAREDLIAALCHSEPPTEALGGGLREESPGCSDAALVLRAYRAWGEACIERIHGEFAFAIWDEAQQRLFCARDRFGVRPFFYAQFPDLFLCGNTLGNLRLHPRVGAELDEQALVDFLAGGQPLDAAATHFRDLRRLPAGHSLTATVTTLAVRKYARLPQDPELRYADPGQYVEHFIDVLSRAVADRAGSGVTGLSLSGGLDSGAIAAVATGRLGKLPLAGVHAFCSGWNCSFTDPEPAFASITAGALGLPLDVHEADDDEPFKRSTAGHGPEPQDEAYRAEFVASLARVAGVSRVNLDGQGGDEIFRGETLRDEARRAPWLQLARDAWTTWRTVRRPPLGLRAARREDGTGGRAGRGVARARLRSPLWGPYLESFDAGFTGIALDTTWCYLDHRVVRFALALPPFPWCVDKHLTRRVLAGVLPAAIAQRPKAPLAGNPLAAFRSRNPGWAQQQEWIRAELEGRLDWPRSAGSWSEGGDPWGLARPVALAHWLRQVRSARPLPRAPSPAVHSTRTRHASEAAHEPATY